MLWEKKTLGPGPTKLIGGNEDAGFYGECPASELITGDELARMIGLTRGGSQFSNEPWLKFSYMGKIEFIAKKPFRYSFPYNDITAANAAFGNRTIKLGDHTYKVRLPKGKSEGKQDDDSSIEGSIFHNSEWNRLMLPIHINAPSSWKYPRNVKSPTENWDVGYTDNDLITQRSAGNGAHSYCQEYGKTGYRLLRGGYGVSFSNMTTVGAFENATGWRPVLELVD